MKTIHLSTLAAVALLWLSGLPARANLIQADDPQFGANSLTIDTTSGLAWLDLTASAGLSYQQTLADTQPGGIFSGFRFATAQEVLTLYTAADIPGTGYFPAATQSILSLIDLIGATTFQDGHPEAIGISGTADSGGRVVPLIDFLYVDGVPTYDVSGVPPSLIYGENTSASGVGNWLVYQIPESPDPSIYVLAAIGLIAFTLLQRQQRASQ